MISALLVFVASSGVSGIGSIVSTAAAASVPFACTTPTVFDAAGTPNTQLFAQTQTSTGSTFTAVGSPWSGGTYNAIAFDTATRLIYAIANSSRSLLAIDSTGAVTNLGAVSGLPLTGNYLVGAMDPSNNYYVENTSTGAIYVINVSTQVATLVVTNPAVGMFDFTYADGFLWGLADSNTGVITMVRIDPVAKVVSTFSVAGLNLPSEFYGAAWTYGNGNLGFDGNLGGVYQIAVANPASATPTFTLVATGPGPASTNNDGTSCSPGAVDLGIAKNGPAVVAPSGTVTWTLTVTNHGPNVSSGFVISDAVPTAYTAVSSTTPGCTVTGHSVSCLGGVLAVGATATVTLRATAPAVGGCLTNTASVLGNEADPNSANDSSSLTTCVPANPAIDLVKSASPTTVSAAGQQVSYTFVVTNTGNSTLSNVSVSDTFTAGGTGTMSAITCQSLTNPAASCSGTTTPLQSGQSATFTSTYTVTQADIDNGHLNNTGTAVGTPPTGPDVTSTSTASDTAVASPKLALQKTVAETALSLGETLHYSFVVTNTGNVTLSSLSIAEQSFSGSGAISPVTCPSTTLAPGASTTCTATYVVSQADVDAGRITNTAVATGTPPAGAPVQSAPSSASVPATSTPALSLVKSASPTAVTASGEAVTYSFVVTNTGNVTMSNVGVVDTSFTGTGAMSAITCPVTTLAPGASTTCTASYAVTQADIDSGSVTNTAVASGAPPGSTTPVTSPPSTVTVTATPEPALALVKSASPTTVTAAGGSVTYSFLVTNTGNVTMSNVGVVDTSFTGTGAMSAITCPVTTLAPGASTTCTASYAVTQADIDSGSVTNTAVASGAPPGSTTPITSPPSTATVTAGASPSLSLVKSASPTTASAAGQAVTYSFAVTNTGNVTMSNVCVSETSFTGSGTLSAITCPVTSLAPGASTTCTASYSVTQADIDAGSVTNTAVASGTPPGSTTPVTSPPSTAAVTAGASPSLSLVKSASPPTASAAGQAVTYSFVVTNTGNVTMSNVSVSEASFTGSGTLSAIMCPVTTLAPGASTTCTASYSVTQADMDAGSVTNTAVASGTPPGSTTPVTSPPSTATVTAGASPSLSLVKSASPTTASAAGQAVTYSFVVTNTGNVTMSNVSVSEASFTGSGTLSAITCPVTSLAPGASTTCTASYSVTQADIDAGSVTNTAVASGTQPGSTTPVTSPPSTVTVPMVADPGVSVVKSATEASVSQVGDTIDYRFLVTNTGNVTLRNVDVADTQIAPAGALTSGPTCPLGVLAPQASETCTATYTVTQADLDNGTVNDSAVAHGTLPDSVTTVASTPSTVSVPTIPRLGLTMVKSANRATVSAAGQVIQYRFLTTNTGNVTLRHVRVVDGMDGLSAISCPTDILAPAASETCTATYTVTQADIDAGSLSNTAVSVARTPHAVQVTSPPSKVTVGVTRDLAPSGLTGGLVASGLAFTGLPAGQITLVGLAILLLGVLLLTVRRRLSHDE